MFTGTVCFSFQNPDGFYAFKARIIDVFNRTSSEASYEFVIGEPVVFSKIVFLFPCSTGLVAREGGGGGGERNWGANIYCMAA